VYQGINIARHARALSAQMSALRALAEQTPDQVDIARLNEVLQAARDDSLALRASSQPFLVIAPYLSWLPRYGGDIQAAPALLDMSVELTSAASTALAGLEPLAAEADGAMSPGNVQRAATVLADARPQLEQARGHLQAAAAARARLDAERLSPSVSRLVEQSDQMLPWFGLALDVGLVLPDLAGLNGPRHYLILVQNEDEIRPTGGFITAYGLVRVDNGRLTELRFEESSAVDNLSGHAYPEPPAPLLTYMRSELWLFRDSNWSPDFPAAARQAAEFYEWGRGLQVDGVIAIDQRAVQLIVSALGPLPPLPGESQPITGENLIQLMRQSRDQSLPQPWQRKDFIGQIAAALRARLDTGLKRDDLVKLAKAAREGLEERHILAYVRAPEAADLLARQGWDGALQPSDGDYLMVVDANLGFNKVNALVEATVQYDVDLTDLAQPQAEVRLAYRHPGQAEGQACRMDPYAAEGYRDLMEKNCYYNYVRVLVPQGSRLQSATRHPVAGEQLLSGQPSSGEPDIQADVDGTRKVSFGKFLVVPVGASTDSHFEYTLPVAVVREEGGLKHYRLFIQKQPGTMQPPFVVTIVLPLGAQVVSTNPEPVAREENWLRFEVQLRTDQRVEVAFR
jgi:hypothetical protein